MPEPSHALQDKMAIALSTSSEAETIFGSGRQDSSAVYHFFSLRPERIGGWRYHQGWEQTVVGWTDSKESQVSMRHAVSLKRRIAFTSAASAGSRADLTCGSLAPPGAYANYRNSSAHGSDQVLLRFLGVGLLPFDHDQRYVAHRSLDLPRLLGHL